MDSQLYFHAGLADHRGLRPNLSSSRSATRVTSDPDKKPQPHKLKHKASHHHHDRRDGHHRHSSSKRHAAKEAVQSAVQIQPPTSFGDLLRQARGSRDTSPSRSRRESDTSGQPDGAAGGKEDRAVGIRIPPRRPLRPADVELEAKRVEARSRDLRAALQSLSDQSLKTSRRLDDTYYSILEKVSVLRQTIGTLQELSGLTKELHDNFEHDTTELVDDVTGQVEAFDGFKAQQKQVNDLEARIQAGKEKADSLASRLTRAQERVDARAKSEAQWHAKNTHRVRMFWGTVGFIAALVFALVLFHPSQPADAVEEAKPTRDTAVKEAISNAAIPDIAREAILGTWSSVATPIAETSDAKPLLEDDERLRGFDEL
ncbi:hypothetical protein BDW02DRAFT_566006 [Decorospora gaudefroyi]|uniref:Uncharacterized protein n=1 Tax=Decorospora gaudefroyi TaxID=184978 RepID=A0A6A5KMZ9_9PLEO|nr:hypothetical protein BDW02DRAFT_566006 [Decorospora gaudefroyi]